MQIEINIKKSQKKSIRNKPDAQAIPSGDPQSRQVRHDPSNPTLSS